MKKIILLLIMATMTVGCSQDSQEKPQTDDSKTEEGQVNDQEQEDVVDQKTDDGIMIDKNWKIPSKGEMTGFITGRLDSHSIEIKDEKGNLYVASTLDLPEAPYDTYESEETKIVMDYEIRTEGGQLMILEIEVADSDDTGVQVDDTNDDQDDVNDMDIDDTNDDQDDVNDMDTDDTNDDQDDVNDMDTDDTNDDQDDDRE